MSLQGRVECIGRLWEFRGRRYYKGRGVCVIGRGLDRGYIDRGGGAYIREEERMLIRIYRREEYVSAKGV